ncbi:hypothetical protein B566_EDAN000704 [Ephemera danica]|nr:hypothetical protein B566_EDAN000704 [Ephemera danica]
METNEAVRASLQTLSCEDLRQLVLQALQNKGVRKLQRLVVAPGAQTGDNFMCVIHRLVADGTADNNQPCHVSFIVKRSPDNRARREFFSLSLLYRNEINFYERVVPALERILTTSLSVPRCMASLCDASEVDALVLEDLRPDDFRMTPRNAGLDFKHCRLVLQELARLHAASFALKSREPQSFQKLKPFVKDLFFDPDRKPNFEPFIVSSYENAYRVILEYFDNDEENKYVNVMRKLVNRGYELVSKIVRNTFEKERVVNHGDCWIGNLLFRYSTITGEAEDVRFLDFQLTRVTSPAIDVTYALYTSACRGVLNLHFDELLDSYHTTLSATLADLGLVVEKIFPRQRLSEEMTRCAAYGLAMCGIVVPAVYCPPECTPDLDAVKGNSAMDFVKAYETLMKANTPECRNHLAEILKFCRLTFIFHIKRMETHHYELLKRALNALNEKSIDHKACEVTAAVAPGENYMGHIWRITYPNISLILKATYQSAGERQAFNLETMFRNEINFYQQILPNLPGCRDLAVPRCFATHCNGKNEDALVLQDLNAQGFKLASREIGLDLLHCQLVLRELARFHASSFALKARDPKKFEQLARLAQEALYSENERANWSPVTTYTFQDCIRMIGEAMDQKYGDVVSKTLKDGFDLFVDMIRGDGPFAVINHGDCWTNNLLFRYSDRGQPEEMRLLDFQFVRYSSFALDFTFFLCTSVRPDVLRSEYENLFHVYYTALSTRLKDLGNAEDTPSMTEVHAEIIRCFSYGLAKAFVAMPFFTRPMSDAEKQEEIPMDVNTTEQVMSRIASDSVRRSDNCRDWLISTVKFLVDRAFLS